MKTLDINIRDPFVMLHDSTYYLYGTRSSTCWGEASGFDCYTSRDLIEWDGPIEVFHRPDGFFADRKYWAPECYAANGKFYLITTLASESRKAGVYALVSDSPLGPFMPVSTSPLTPDSWTCIDGSLYFDEHNAPFLLFSHSFEDTPNGDMCVLELAKDLTHAVSEPKVIFKAADAPWARPVPFAKAEFGMDGDVYFSDGPCAHRLADGSLVILWASWSNHGYAVGAALSESGSIYGPWKHLEEKVFPENGGHGALFTSKEGELLYTLHYPNDLYKERPVFFKAAENENTLILEPSNA